MATIERLAMSEGVRLDPDRIVALYFRLGAAQAERRVARIMDDVALTTDDLPRLLSGGRMRHARLMAERVISGADEIGLTSLARVARDLIQSLDARDRAAIGATASRLERVAARSMAEIWDMHRMMH